MPAQRQFRRGLRLRATLRQHLALQDFVCGAFGASSPREMLRSLRDATGAEGLLLPDDRLEAVRRFAVSDPGTLVGWDRNIRRHEQRLRMTSEFRRSLKPHQYLALLFTEYYLDRYFARPADLLAELNEHLDAEYRALPRYGWSDLETLAFQSATGSGKTLLMHVHIEQYRHYAQRAGRSLRSVILLTPNERMSEQHLRELEASGLPARLFTAGAPRDLISRVEVFDLNKLAEKQGVKRIAVSEFGDDNLVLVDEGHLGASGKVWRNRRVQLARGGFTFEYSATFEQIVGKERSLRDAYAKSVLFDYPYRDFYEDGYGKDYSIANLPAGVQDKNSDIYLLGCLLTFYRQLRLFRNRNSAWRAFHLARPLMAFLGKTVLGSNKAAVTTRSDVVLILSFLGRFLAERSRIERMIDLLRSGKSGLLDDSGGDWFSGRVASLNGGTPSEIYVDVCETLFYGLGQLHVEYLTRGQGELHLRVADNPVFGVVNVGDAGGLHQLLCARDDVPFSVEKNRIASPLFAGVDREDSTVNVVIGARRFIAGWNSWRVSTMGLMHVGVREGPEIVQMFGRGVRLRGWNMSLKRHAFTGAPPPPDQAALAEVETLNIFGLRANYMETFRDLMREEGLLFETATIQLPVTWNFSRVRDLKILRLPPGRPFEYSEERLVPPDPKVEGRPVIRRNLYSAVEVEMSSGGLGATEEKKPQADDLKKYRAFFDETRIYERVLARKEQARKGDDGWRNLSVDRSIIRRLLETESWYELFIPPDQHDARSVADLLRLEELAADLIAEYCERSWKRARSRWQETRIRAVPLDENDDNNIRSYQLTGGGAYAQLVRDIERLEGAMRQTELGKIGLHEIFATAHAYEPLLWSSADSSSEVRTVEVRPVPLNCDEQQVVGRLRAVAESGDASLGGRDLYLIRNLSRGRGVSFFDDFGYYPDFIVWLRNDRSQHVVFLDPKGLGRYGRREDEKVRLHHRIKDIEVRIQETEPGLFLHAYVLSTTPAAQIDEGIRSVADWKKRGVYFLDQDGSVKEVIRDALAQEQ